MKTVVPSRPTFIAKTSAAQIRAAAWLICVACCTTQGQNFVPFAIPSQIDADQAMWVKDRRPITIDSERLAAHGGHFYRNEQTRIWGVNLCFGANFPTHGDAALVAIRMAAAGVNSVRLHHMDTSRWPAGIWAQDGRTIEPEALDRLDYFINELAQRGIFVNVNLHVGHKHSEVLGLPETNREFDKIYGIFTPALIDAQKQYAREILTHVNPYRKVRYADDPAVAFVEITNEDSFFMWDGDETLRTLPPYYADILQGRFNSWLSERYKSNEALAAAWGKNVEPLGQDMADNGRFIAWDEGGNAPAHWNLEQHEGCQVTLSRLQNQARESLQVSVAKFDETQWHLQLSQGGLQLAEGRYYTLSFEAIGQAKRQIGCIVGQAHTPWNNLGLSRTANLATEWQTFEFGFVATDSDDDARISFAFSGDATQFQIARVELHPGGQAGLADGESATAGSVKLFGDNESMARVVDRMIFLAETEKAYFDDMRSFIKKDLACGALVTGTIVFGPLGLYAQSDMDYIDSHSYWQHPTFPGRPWDSNNWLIEQKPMTDYPQQATLFRIAAERLADKPFTLSEYNHPAPLDAQAECVPMIASFAAAQDWDGVWLFDYSSSANPRDHDKMSGFFDIDGNPAKWGFMRAGTAIFRDSNIEPVSGPIYFSIAGVQTKSQDVLPRLAELCLKHNGSLLSIAGEDPKRMLTARYIAAFTGRYNHNDNFRRNPRIDWTTENDTGVYAIQGSGASVYVGHAGRFEKATAGKISVTQPQFVALTMTGLDGQERMQHNRILVTACGRCENVEMQFSADRRTVGRNWGQAPAQIEAVRGTIVLPEGKWVCHALAPDGAPKQQVAVADKDGRGVLAMSPEYGTMWYLLERQTE